MGLDLKVGYLGYTLKSIGRSSCSYENYNLIRYTMVYPIFSQTHFFKERIHDIQCKSRVDPTDESTKGANI